MTLGKMEYTTEERVVDILDRLDKLESRIKDIDNRLDPSIDIILDKAAQPMLRKQAIDAYFRGLDRNLLNGKIAYPPLNIKDEDNKPDIKIAEEELERKISNLLKSSDPYRLNKIYELQLEFNKKYGATKVDNPNGILSSPNPEHYYEDGMPRLDKYLAYVELREYGQSLDDITKRLFLLSKDCRVTYVTNTAGFGYIEFSICGLVDIKKFERHELRFKFDTTCPGALMVLMSMFNSFQNGGKLTKECIYGETLNEFRTICFEIDSKCVDATITNTIYSTYGCMEENEPRWEDTIRERAQIIVEP